MKNYKYLVLRHWEDDPEDETSAEIMTANKIFAYMDMEDCFPCHLELELWRINDIGQELTACTFLGTWHDPSDPMKMAIVGGGIRETGYGTDH